MATVRKKRPQEQDEQIVEKGDIFFFYRPRVEHEEADGLEDIQRFFMVLKPEGAPFRVAVLGRKRLPIPTGTNASGGSSTTSRSAATRSRPI